MLVYLIFGITYAFAAAIQPGPFQTYIISQALSKGWKPTLPAAFAPLLSDAPIIILVLIFLSNVSESFIHILQIGGGLFLLFLAFNTYKTWQAYDETEPAKAQSGKKTLLKAAFVNLLGPGPYLGWSLVMGPLFLEGWRKAPVNGIVLVTAFYITMTISLAGIIFIFASARKLGPRVTRITVIISIIGLVCFSFYELWLGAGYFVKG